VLAPERLRGLRVVADAAAIDGARWSGDRDELGRDQGGVEVLRFAPDEAFAIGARHVELDDEHALVSDERGFVAWRVPMGEGDEIERHLEWRLPEPNRLAQGALAGVPVKLLWSVDTASILVVANAAYARDLAERLGWDR